MTTPTCDAIAEELVAFLDGEVTEAERVRIEAHTATCLTCRREMDRIGKMNALLTALPRIEPSPEFEASMWQRLEAEIAPRARRRGFRPAMWGVPLAAAAALALVWYSSISPTAPTAPGGGTNVVRAPQAAPAARVDAIAQAERQAPAAAPAEAPVEHAKAELAPEDLPPELLEHPELFLRLPVVRRLEKLEHFEEVRTPRDAEPIGAVESGSGALG